MTMEDASDPGSAPSERLTPRFIVDLPATSDELSPHQRIADSVIEVLHGDERIKLIGLLGGWGSGKSTVVKLIELGLKKPDAPTVECFTFDAWEHQSDPPRRAFMEALAFFLRTNGQFDHLKKREGHWRKVLDGLNLQQEERRTKTTPLLTVPAAWFIISLVGMNAGLRMIGDGTLSEVDQRDLWAWVVFVAGWFLVLGPLIVFLVTWARWRPAFRFSWSWFTTHREDKADQSLLAQFANKPVDERHELTLRNPDPTAMEFQAAFRALVHEALTPGAEGSEGAEGAEGAEGSATAESPRFVVIVDNLDRLPPDEAMTIWSTVRSLFLGSDHDQPISRDRLPTVIMPIDDVALRRIYKDKTDAEGALAQSFIDKTFDLVFHVPQPVLSRWHGYLRKRLDEVFQGEAGRDWPHAIASAYEAWLARSAALDVKSHQQEADGDEKPIVWEGLAPTPREINALVNTVAVLWMQRRDDPIPMEIIAHYAVWRRDLGDLHQHLKAMEGLGRSFTEDEKLQLAALAYGVKLEDAAELFLDEPLRLAIETRDPDRFAALVGYDRHFLRFLQAAAAHRRHLQAWFAAELLARMPDLPDAWARDAWTALRSLAVARAANERGRPIDLPGLDALVANAGNDARPFLQAVRHAMAGLGLKSVEGDKAVEYALFAQRLAEHAEAMSLKDFDVRFPGSAKSYAEMLRQDVPLEALRVLVPSGEDLDAVIQALAVQTAGLPSRQDIAESVARLVARGPDDLNWNPLIDTLHEIITHRRLEVMPDVVKTLFELCLGPVDAHSSVHNLGLMGRLDVAHEVLWSQGPDADALATSTALLMRMNKPALSADHRSWNDRLNEQPELPRLVHERLVRSGFQASLAWAMERSGARPDETPLLSALVALWADQMEINPEAVFNDTEAVKRLVSPDALPAFWRRMSQREGFWDRLRGLDLNQAAPIFHALRESKGPRSRLMKALAERFRQVSEQGWKDAVETGQEPYGLAAALAAPSASSTNTGPTAHAALTATTGEMVTRDDDAYRNRWFDLARKLSPAARVTLHRRVVLEMVSRVLTGRGVSDILMAGGPALLAEGDFAAHADAVVAHMVLPMASDIHGLDWLIVNAETVRPWVRKSKPATRSALREQLVSLVMKGNVETRDLVRALGLSPTIAPPASLA